RRPPRDEQPAPAPAHVAEETRRGGSGETGVRHLPALPARGRARRYRTRRDPRFDRLRRVRAGPAPPPVGAALGLAGSAHGDDPQASAAAGAAAVPTVPVVVHEGPYLRRRREWLSDELRTEDGLEKPWLDWYRATGDWGGLRPQLEQHGVLLGIN